MPMPVKKHREEADKREPKFAGIHVPWSEPRQRKVQRNRSQPSSLTAEARASDSKPNTDSSLSLASRIHRWADELLRQKRALQKKKRRQQQPNAEVDSSEEETFVDHATRVKKPIQERMFSLARVVTMERKYKEPCTCVAELWCTLTSPFFGITSLLWLFPPPGIAPGELVTSMFPRDENWVQELLQLSGLDEWIYQHVPQWKPMLPLASLEHPQRLPLPPLTHFCALFSLVVSLASVMYHKTLYKVYSTLDCAIATIMCYLIAIQIWSPHLRQFYHQSLRKVAAVEWLPDFDVLLFGGTILGVFLPLSFLFLRRWDGGTSRLAPKAMGAAMPVIALGLHLSEGWPTVLCGVVAISCFLLDRRGVLPLHPLWHVFGGIFMWWSVWKSVELEARVRRLYG